MYRFCSTACLILAVAWTLACTPPPKGAAPAANVKGVANIDGKPIANGEIHFGMTGVPPSVLAISKGEFAGEAPIGKNQVEVFIFVEGPRSEKYGGIATKKNTVPDKYWGPNTILDATVTAGAANEFKFDLTSK